MSVRSTLINARRLVEAGWCQRSFETTRDGKKYVCLSHAIAEGCEGDHGDSIDAHLVMRTRLNTSTLSIWNDLTTTTKQMVLDALDSAIADIKE